MKIGVLTWCSLRTESFLGGLGEFNTYLTSLKSPSDFSGEELRRIMASFHEPFENHFHSEISTIADMAGHPKAPQAGSPEETAASAMFKAWGKTTVSKAGVLDVVPFFLLNLDRSAEAPLWENWPPMPNPIKVCELLSLFVLFRPRRGFVSSNPRRLTTTTVGNGQHCGIVVLELVEVFEL